MKLGAEGILPVAKKEEEVQHSTPASAPYRYNLSNMHLPEGR